MDKAYVAGVLAFCVIFIIPCFAMWRNREFATALTRMTVGCLVALPVLLVLLWWAGS